MSVKVFQNGEVIFREGDDGAEMYRVLEGKVGVFSGYGEKDEQKLTELGEGDYLGEMAVIEVYPRSADAVALEDGTRLETISAESLAAYLTRHSGEEMALMRHLSRRLRELTGDYSEICATLRELGYLEKDKPVGGGLMDKIKRFAAVYFKQKKSADSILGGAEPEKEPDGFGKSYGRQLKNCEPGDVIFREGEQGRYLYDVRSGRVGIYSGYGTEKQKLLTELVPSHIFGEMGLIEKLPRSATAVAMEKDTCVEPVGEEDLNGLFERDPAKALAILRHLSHRLRRLTVDYLRACKTLAEAEWEIEAASEHLSAEAQARLEYMRQVMIMPEILY